MEAKIIFEDGTEITAEVNGSSYITAEIPVFPESLGRVTVQEKEAEKVLQDVTIQECASIDGRYWFTLLEKSAEQKEKEAFARLKAMTDYNIMMGVLEDPTEEEENE